MSDGSVVFMYATDSDWKSDFLHLRRMEESRSGHVTARLFRVSCTEPNIKSELYSIIHFKSHAILSSTFPSLAAFECSAEYNIAVK